MPAQALNPDDFEYAGLWIRILASLVDTAVVCLILVPLFFWFGQAAPLPYGFSGGSYELPGNWDFIATKLLPAAYAVVFWHFRGATPGKSVFGLMVVDARSGTVPGFGQSLGRYLAYFVSALPLALGFLWIAFDSRKQGWHDKLAGTVVVRARKQATEKVSFG